MGLYTPFVGRLSFSCRPATTQAPLKRGGVKTTLLGVRHVRIISIIIPNYGMHPIIKGVCNEAYSECKG